ncbi:MAG: phosphoglucosamine mutase [Pseudomonadales bacterium]|jgi:phosphoglucosamine mutase
MARKYFGTDGIRGLVGQHPITPEFVMKLGWAAGKIFAQQGKGKVFIGKDTRISGYMFESALEAGLVAAGVDVALLGPMPTPAIAYLTRTFQGSGGIVISASHNAFYDNGIKFFSGQGTKFPDELELQIEAMIDEPFVCVDSAQLGKVVRIADAPGRYIEFCKSTVRSDFSLEGLKIVLDCAHGATYHLAPNVFSELGAEVIVIGDKPDGLNINKDVGSTYPENLRKLVIAESADMGIAFDGDGDRLLFIDGSGRIVDGDELLYIIAAGKKAAGKICDGVVGTLMSNLGFEQALARLGIGFSRANVGDRYVIAEMQAKGWDLGGESSGHIICADVTTTGDGIIAALKVLQNCKRLDKSLAQALADVHMFPQKMINVKASNRQALAGNKAIEEGVAKAEQRLGSAGRVLLRPSGTEPVVRVMIEGEDEALVSELVAELATIVEVALA